MKNTRALALLFAANFISKFATGITIVAIPWYLVSYMGAENGKFLNTVLMGCITFGSLFWGTYAGTLIDRYNRKHIFQVLTFVDFILLCCAATYGYLTHEMPFPLLAIVATSTIFTFTIHYPNLYAFVQELFEPRYYSKVNSAIELQGQITTFFGMMAAGLFLSGSETIGWWPDFIEVERWKMWEIFLFDGITYLISCIIISFIIYTPDPNRHIDKGSVSKRVIMGFNYLWERKPLLVFGICSYVIFFSLLVFIQVALPIYIADYLTLDQVKGGLVFTQWEMFYALGAICAGLFGVVLARLLRKVSLIRQIIFMLLLAGLLYFAWSITPSIWILVAGGLFMGLTNAGTRIQRVTYIIRLVPGQVVGRVNSFFQVANVLMRSTMILLIAHPFFSGPGNGGNIVYILMIMGGLCFLSAGVLIIWYKRFDQSAAFD